MTKITNDHKLGKLSGDFGILRPGKGRRQPKNLLVGPGIGLDNAVIRLDGGKVLVGKTDPISWIPKLGPVDSAWLSIHQITSDFVTSGVLPEYAFFELNLPQRVTDRELREYWNSLYKETKSLGIAVAGGHTGRYEGCDFTIVGGATLLGVGAREDYLTPRMARKGDSIIVTKGAAIECTAILARIFPETVSDRLGRSSLQRWQKLFPLISSVKDAIVAMEVGKSGKTGIGGITSMHDVEEGGVLSANCEVAIASKLGFAISKNEIPVLKETKEICDIFGIHDPYTAIGGGSLIITASPDKAERVVQVLGNAGILAEVVGKMEHRNLGFKFADDPQHKIVYPVIDPYWEAFKKATEAGWN